MLIENFLFDLGVKKFTHAANVVHQHYIREFTQTVLFFLLIWLSLIIVLPSGFGELHVAFDDGGV